MNSSIHEISLLNLALAFLPVAIVVWIIIRWSLDTKNILYATIRMLGQLLLIGYFLNFIFTTDSSLLILAVLVFMMLVSSWISLRTVKAKRVKLLKYAVVSMFLGGASTLALVTQGVVQLDPWFLPRYMIPIAGMVFANAMTSISLAIERLFAEKERNLEYKEARKIAFQASLIPIVNSFFAVGLVSIPGMMTGQILSGISPLIAARYQIMVMCMVFGAAGISTAFFLKFIQKEYES